MHLGRIVRRKILGSVGCTAVATTVLGGVVSTQAAAAADTTMPALNSFSMDGSPAAAGDTVTVHYDATDDSGALQSVIFQYTDPIGNTRQIRNDGPLPLTGTVQQDIPDTWPNGTYRLDYLYLIDPSGNDAIYNRVGTIRRQPAGATGPDTHTFDLSTANLTVTGSSADTTMPTLNAFSVDGSPAAPGDTVTAHYDASDAAGMLQAVIFQYTDPIGNTR